jgi:hypothetical protein
MLLFIPGVLLAADETEHWVYPELIDYKQKVVKFKDSSSVVGPVTQEEWKSFHYNVLDSTKLDEPIQIYHWVTMIKMGVDLPKGQEDSLINGYVYNLVQMYDKEINRETAVGGLIKLLSLSIVNASWDHTQADAAKALTDFEEISEMQNGLVRIAYRDGLLDSGTKDKFRPQQKLTHAEAISIMYKVLRKYEQAKPLVELPKGNWAAPEVNQLMERQPFTKDIQQGILAGLGTDDRMPVSLWHELLATVLGFTKSIEGREVDYTYGLGQDGFIRRDRAVAGLMKLWGPSRDATEAERKAADQTFSDYRIAFDPSKLAIAYSLGVVQGYGSTFGPERGLTYNEALVLLSRVVSLGVQK